MTKDTWQKLANCADMMLSLLTLPLSLPPKYSPSSDYIIGRAWVSPTLLWSTGARASTDWPGDQLTDRPTVSVPFTWYWYVARAHAAKPPCHTHVRHVNSSVRSGDSYKTENADDGKAKSRDTRATNCEAGMRERPANFFILALPCRCRHASLGFTYVSFSRQLLHTNTFSHFPT